ncbi:MAG: permease prefix domain 2-containing transporter [Bryobacteraceae bacterium]
MAAESTGMMSESPPRWLQRLLLLFLKGRDRETIFGDLLEEYREERLPRAGPLRANYWYLRQAISLASIQIPGGSVLKQMLILMSLFIMAAGTWLGVMENILKHDGYVARSVIAVCIVIQGLATLLVVLLRGGTVLRIVVTTGGAVMVWLGVSAILKMLRSEHFEGFVLIIGVALVLQGGLAVATLLMPPHRHPAT